MAAVLLALAASISWGCGDFLGGLASRRIPTLTVLFVSQCVALAVFATIVAVTSTGVSDDPDFLLYAAAAGLAEAVGLAAFYRGLAIGAMGVVSPIAASAAILPIGFGLLRGETPSATAAAGIALALCGAVLVAWERGGVDGAKRMAVGVGLALFAALGFGSFFVAMDAAVQRGDVLSAVLVNRVTLVAIVGLAVAVLRPPLAVPGSLPIVVIAVGIFDIAGTTLYAAATTQGLLVIVGMLGALYPVMTVVLAWLVLDERLQASQRLGTAVALAGVVLIGAGA